MKHSLFALMITLMSVCQAFAITNDTNPTTPPCDITFFCNVSQENEKLPFCYEDGKACNLASIDVQIFNQFGESIFQTKDLNFKWNGTTIKTDKDGAMQEVTLPEGTYYYTAKYKFKNDKELRKKGGALQVTL